MLLQTFLGIVELEPPATDWASLPSEILSLIASKRSSGDAAKYITLKCVCRQWCHGLTMDNPIPPLSSPQLPFLLVPPHLSSNPSIGGVFPLPIFTHFSTPTLCHNLPILECKEFRHPICIGSSYGWLITLDEFSQVLLLNPVTGDSIKLECLSSILNFFFPDKYRLKGTRTVYNKESIVRLAVLSSDPASDKNFIVLLFLRDLKDCCLTSKGRNGKWIRHDHKPFLRQVEDAIFFSGVFVVYAMQSTIAPKFGLTLFDFRDYDSGLVERQVKVVLPDRSKTVFLVAANCHLWIVYLLPQSETHYKLLDHVVYFDHFRVDGSENHPDILTGLDDDFALFLGKGCSVAVSKENFPWLTAEAYWCHTFCVAIQQESNARAVVWNRVMYFGNRPLNSSQVFYLDSTEKFTNMRPVWVSPNLKRLHA